MARRVKRKKADKDMMQIIFTRFMLIVALFIMWIGGVTVRLVNLQVTQNEWLSEKAQNQRRDFLKSKMLRGTIYDRSERALAMSVKAKSLYADPHEIDDLNAAATRIAGALDKSKNEVLRLLTEAREKERRFVWIERKIDEERIEGINDSLAMEGLRKPDLPKMAGLHWKEEQKRMYPYKSLAAQVIGFSNSDDIGQAGIEQSNEDILKGEVVKGWQERDRLGRVYDESEAEREPPKDIVLTISNSIQYKTEEALEKGVKASNSTSGMAVVIDPKTGEVLALANYPTFDLNEYSESKPEVWKNKAVQDVYSPGSVFKAIAYGGALEEKIINPNGQIDGRKGYIKVGGRRFDDPHATRIMTYTEALAISSNFAAIKTALGLGKDRFYNYARKFGFGEQTGIQLPAESGGVLRSPESWNGDSLASMAIGYEISITALQAASAYGAIANDGVRVQPHIVKEIRDSEGNVISRPEPTRTEVFSPETARALRRMLQQVVLRGTAKRAQLNGYSSAGKTGTAWKYDPKLKKYNPAKYISSFVGFAPVENPSVVIAVVMDEPRGGARDGGQVAAPVFKEIAEQILPELSVVPDAAISPRQISEAEDNHTTDGDVFDAADSNDKISDDAGPAKKPDAAAKNEVPKETEKKPKPPADRQKPKPVPDDKEKKKNKDPVKPRGKT